ncbi:phage integrase Arm DNA-binding domain-containing protein [Hafnia paralvei]|uniref:phage integrase Arm DNA-binding domain-containing protein n=1 Tax=Hafnia paralvei TaxID=546367 RepID=UPI00241D0731|nr:phage integrase Arm DNA-binding domain-containing protein [Hafnia paralvei]
MARPRKYNVSIPGLSCYLDARTNKVYWRYKHPTTGKFHGLGTNEAEAKAIAIEANTRIATQQMNQMIKLRDKISHVTNSSISVSGWVEKYSEQQEKRLKIGEIKLGTLRQKKGPLKTFVSLYGIKPLTDVTTRDVVHLLNLYLEKEQYRMAQIVRKVLIDVFKEAQHSGEVPPSFNPALATRNPKAKITRQRLSLDEWKLIYDAAAKSQPYLQRSMLLALTTGQRLGDISNMKFTDIWDGYLHVQQSKTGAKIALPLSLKCDAIGLTLGEIISLCRDKILSPYLLHHHHAIASAKRGGQVLGSTITTLFSKVRDGIDYPWTKSGTAATFHEQRSLSERLYREQGIDTQTLLGHKNQQMTDRYNDDRGKDWKQLII